MRNNKLLLILSLLGLADSLYLTYEHYSDSLTTCSTGVFSSCNDVLTSSYSEFYGIPTAMTGVFHYLILSTALYYFLKNKNKLAGQIIVLFSITGFIFSIYLIYLQALVLNAYCIYCMFSAFTSTLLFVLVWQNFYKFRKLLIVEGMSLIYKNILKPILFKFDPEAVHVSFIKFGKMIGKLKPFNFILSGKLKFKDSSLEQNIKRIKFTNPIGLAAGFDYEADLTEVLSSVGFGFQTIGTITNYAYKGNPKPRLGRLPKSRSLMVNKGFKNKGADAVIKKLSGMKFTIPLGISIGRTNSKKLISQKDSVNDIVAAFEKFETSELDHAYYELNISCPNLYGDINFYTPENLDELLVAVDNLNIKRPIFIKMPIEKSDQEVLQMMEIITKHNILGLIFGNLQKNRKDKTFDPEEIGKFSTGNFSGKPTFKRSNELISLAYKNYKERFVIIGCGGVFSAEDAYEKIKRGASLVQLITGMIFEGPQLISKINIELTELLENDGFENIKDAVGSYYQ